MVLIILILFMLKSVWYCGISVFFGLVRILISEFLFNECRFIIIGSWFMNLGIILNFIRFCVLIMLRSLFCLVLLFFIFGCEFLKMLRCFCLEFLLFVGVLKFIIWVK